MNESIEKLIKQTRDAFTEHAGKCTHGRECLAQDFDHQLHILVRAALDLVAGVGATDCPDILAHPAYRTGWESGRRELKDTIRSLTQHKEGGK